MSKNRRLFTSESVTEGHPDKIADQISDAILDELLKGDPKARVACETTVTTGMALISGEISTSTYVDIPKVVRETVKDIGYTRAKYGYDFQTMAILTAIDEQSPDIAQGVDCALEDRDDLTDSEIESIGAGDQGLMFGYATNETETYMPLPVYLAHQLSKRLTDVRKDGTLEYLRPDGKTQVTIEYDENDKPLRVDTIVVSSQHHEKIELEKIQQDIKDHVIYPIVPKELLDDQTKFFINPTGRFVIGGPQGDAGLTGRKIIVDTYGGYARHGGGCFSGKDPTKVDRSAAYKAREIAKDYLRRHDLTWCLVQISYAIGIDKPLAIYVNSNKGYLPVDEKLYDECTPKQMIKDLNLLNTCYEKRAMFGHFTN